MAENNSYIKINIWQLLVVALLVTLTVLGGSWWNRRRLDEKLVRIKASVERIYQARKDEIIKAIKTGEKVSEINLLRQINEPEKGILSINFLIIEGDGYRLVSDMYTDGKLNSDKTSYLRQILADDKSVATDVDVFPRQQWEGEKVYAFTPILGYDGKLLGYMVLGINRKQNI